MSRTKLLVLTVTLLAGAGTAIAKDPHPVYRGVGVGFVRIPSGYAPAGYGYSYSAPAGSYGYSYSVPAAGYSYAAPSYGYGGNYGYGSASYGFGGAHGAAPQGFFFPGGGDPFSAIESAINLFKKLREGGLGGADSKDIEKLRTELKERLDKIDAKIDVLEKDYKELKVPQNLTNRIDDLKKRIVDLETKVAELEKKKN